MGALSVGMGGARPSHPIPWIIAGALVLGGAALFLKRPFVYWVALGASALTVVTGLVGLAGHPALALPVPPALSIGVGLYLCLRVLMARAQVRLRTARLD
jgi:hypothetical protein